MKVGKGRARCGEERKMERVGEGGNEGNRRYW